jgi:hypothetical protein
MLLDYKRQTGARALRMDHYQVIVPNVGAALQHYLQLGFRVSK